jgi:hypothetical protein
VVYTLDEQLKRQVGLVQNILYRKELTPYQRGKILGARDAGASYGDIENMYGIPRYTVITTTRRSTLRVEGKSLPRQGRPPSHDDRIDRRIIRYVRINPKTTYAQMRRALDSSWPNSNAGVSGLDQRHHNHYLYWIDSITKVISKWTSKVQIT